MPIVVNLDVQLAIKKMTIAKLSEKVGLTVQNLHVLKANKARGLRFVTLSAICKALDCQPGDILQDVTDKEYKALFPDWEPDPDY